MDPSGNLFGVTYSGGKYGAGDVFEFNPAGQYSVLHSFCKRIGCPDGSMPGRVSLVIDVNGNLYGTTMHGGNPKHPGGVVFELVRTDSGWHEVTLYKFCNVTKCGGNGDLPLDGLTYAGAASGQLYDGTSPLFGTTQYGGANAGGIVFSLTPSGSKQWNEQVLYSFCSQTNCADGTNPDTPLYIDAQGNIYGTTPNGGQGNNGGVVFELSPSGSSYTESVLYSFCSQANCADGAVPRGGVISDGQGNLYGPTTVGGADDDGLIFELSPNGTQWQFSELADFNGANGHLPWGTLIRDSNGNLFGAASSGGTKQDGTVFEFNGSLQSLYSFCPERGCQDGKFPSTGVVEDSAGNLYGATAGGGGNGGGTLYELSP
jgi:uncharacterized repeat protein (TIGR03803 family)